MTVLAEATVLDRAPRPAQRPGESSPARRIPLGAAAAALGAVGTLVTWLGSWNPSYWGDEAATVLSAERPIGTLFAELRSIDAVHGVYYLVMHFWIQAFGASELSTRLPSVLAVGAMVAGTVVLGARLADPRFGVVAGVVSTLLPRTTFLATEARSYAIGVAIAVWLTVFFVALWQRRETRLRPWIGYGLLVAAASYLFLYLLLLLAVHGAVLLASPAGRARMRGWLVAAVVAIVAASPIVAIAYAERHQVAFLASPSHATAGNVLVAQWFGGAGITVAAWALILLGAIAVSSRALRESRSAYLNRGESDRAVVLLAGAWTVIPTALLLVGNAWVSPMYNSRYLAFCTPAVAMLVALGAIVLARLLTPALRRVASGLVRRREGRPLVELTTVALAVVLVALAALAVPGYLAQRGPYAKSGGSDLRQVADYIQQNARRGDAVVFDQATRQTQRPGLAARLYPAQFAGLRNVEIVTPYYERTRIWDQVAPLRDVISSLDASPTVWALELAKPGVAVPADIDELTAHGYRVVGSRLIHRITVYRLQKEGA